MKLSLASFGKVFLGVIILTIGLFGGTCSNTLQALAAPQSDSVVTIEQAEYQYQSPVGCNCGEKLGTLTEARTSFGYFVLPDLQTLGSYEVLVVTDHNSHDLSPEQPPKPEPSRPPDDVSITHWPIQLARSGI